MGISSKTTPSSDSIATLPGLTSVCTGGFPSGIPDRLPQLAPERALAVVELPLALNWSQPGRVFHLADRGDRARVYEIVLREGSPGDVLAYVDGNLLVDLWPELVLPRDMRAAWLPLIDRFTAASDAA